MYIYFISSDFTAYFVHILPYLAVFSSYFVCLFIHIPNNNKNRPP